MVLINAFTFAMYGVMPPFPMTFAMLFLFLLLSRHWHPPATVFTCTLVVEKTLFSVSAGALNSGPSAYWASMFPRATTLGFLEKCGCSSLVTGLCFHQFTDRAKLKTGIISVACYKSQDCSLQALGPLWWLKEFLTKETNTDLTSPHLKHVLPTYKSASSIKFHHSQKLQLDNS